LFRPSFSIGDKINANISRRTFEACSASKSDGNKLAIELSQPGQNKLEVRTLSGEVSLESISESELVLAFGWGTAHGTLVIPLTNGIVSGTQTPV
jgi:hypothetical protein